MHNFSAFILAQTSTETGLAIRDLLRSDGVVVQLILAIVILVSGWILAIFFASMTKIFLKRIDIDNKLAGWLTESSGEPFPIEKWISSVVFWIILLFTLVGFFQFLKLDAVATPLNSVLGQITSFLLKLGGASVLIGIAWVLATISKAIVRRFLRSSQIDSKINETVGDPKTKVLPLSETLSSALYWFIWLLFLPLVLDTLGFVQALEPLKNLVTEILGALPNILKAVMIGGIGWLIAQAVKRIITNLLATSGADRFLQRWTSQETEYALSKVVGNFVYVLILIPTVVSTLEALEIEAISRPATDMLGQVLGFLPQIFVASAILTGAYFLGQFTKDIIAEILTGLGFNNILQWLGFESITTPAVPLVREEKSIATLPPQTPSQVVGIIVFLGIMLVAIAAATDILNVDALTRIVFEILQVAGQVLSGIIILAIGLYLANLAFNLIASTGGRQAKILGNAARISILALITAMALKQMGIASNIVDLAFGLLVGSIAVAIAVAFGLGGKEIASQQLREWLASFTQTPEENTPDNFKKWG